MKKNDNKKFRKWCKTSMEELKKSLPMFFAANAQEYHAQDGVSIVKVICEKVLVIRKEFSGDIFAKTTDTKHLGKGIIQIIEGSAEAMAERARKDLIPHFKVGDWAVGQDSLSYAEGLIEEVAMSKGARHGYIYKIGIHWFFYENIRVYPFEPKYRVTLQTMLVRKFLCDGDIRAMGILNNLTDDRFEYSINEDLVHIKTTHRKVLYEAEFTLGNIEHCYYSEPVWGDCVRLHAELSKSADPYKGKSAAELIERITRYATEFGEQGLEYPVTITDDDGCDQRIEDIEVCDGRLVATTEFSDQWFIEEGRFTQYELKLIAECCDENEKYFRKEESEE